MLKDKPSKYMKEKLGEMKGVLDSSAVMVGDFNTPFWIMDQTTRQKTRKEREDLNITVNQLGVADTHRHPPHNSCTHIPKCTCENFQDRPYVRPQTKSQYILTGKHPTKYLLWPRGGEVEISNIKKTEKFTKL